METLKKHWFRVPGTIRKPVVLVIGMLLVIISPFTGVLPGPGGIPIFLIGVAILSTEFEWARRLREWTLKITKQLGEAWKRHKFLGTVIAVTCAAAVAALSYAAFKLSKTIM